MAVLTPPKRWLLTGGGLAVFLTAVHATNDAFTSMLAALLPTLQLQFGLSETVLALLVATLSFSSSVTQPLFGALADRLGRRLVGALGVILSSSLLSLMAVVPSVYLLVAVLFFGGLGSAAFHPAAISMARAAGGGRHKALVVSVFSAGGTVGLALGPIIILFVIANFGVGFTPWLMVPGVLMGVMTYLLIPPQKSSRESRPKLFDARLLAGPVGLLCLSGILRSISFVTFANGVPLWLVNEHGLAPDDQLIGFTLAAFSFSAGVGGVIAGGLGRRVSRQWLITGTTLLALAPLLGLFWLTPGTPAFFLAVIAAGALVNSGLPLMIVSAQDLAPHAIGTASGLLMGFTWGTAGVLYIGIGWLQEQIGLVPAMSLSFLTLIPGAALAYLVLKTYRAAMGD
ncbi:MAG: MFS transporter [Truepera sp.]|nr:MFS transporter [Truepera sp.]